LEINKKLKGDIGRHYLLLFGHAVSGNNHDIFVSENLRHIPKLAVSFLCLRRCGIIIEFYLSGVRAKGGSVLMLSRGSSALYN